MGVDLDKIRTLRDRLKLTQEQAASKAGMTTRQQWNNIESGRRSPTIDTLERIGKALGVKAKDLLK